jgi:excisionase family DNA binding protein
LEQNSDWITTQEAAELIGVSRDHVTHLLRVGHLEGNKLLRDWLVSRTSAEQYAAQDRKPGPRKR